MEKSASEPGGLLQPSVQLPLETFGHGLSVPHSETPNVEAVICGDHYEVRVMKRCALLQVSARCPLHHYPCFWWHFDVVMWNVCDGPWVEYKKPLQNFCMQLERVLWSQTVDSPA